MTEMSKNTEGSGRYEITVTYADGSSEVYHGARNYTIRDEGMLYLTGEVSGQPTKFVIMLKHVKKLQIS